MYEETNFDVNLGKVFLKQRTDEFLRQLAMNGDLLTGYPARGVASLLYRNPTSREFAVGEDRIFELAQNWLTVIRRAGTLLSKAESHMIKDISAANGISKQVTSAILHAPAVRGGLGLAPLNNKRIIIKKSVATHDFKTPVAPLAQAYTLPNIITKIWLAGVDPGPKSKTTHTRFEVKVVEEAEPVRPLLEVSDLFLVRDRPSRTTPIFKQHLSPSEVSIAQEQMKAAKMKGLRLLAADFLQFDSYCRFVSLANRASIAVLKAWLTDDLQFRVPSNWQQSSTLVARAYKAMVARGFNKLITRSRITKKQH